MRHSQLTNGTDSLSKFKRNIDEILLQINTLSKTDRSEAFSYVYKHFQSQESLVSRRKGKLPPLVKKRKLRAWKCPVCNDSKETKVALLKHLERLHVDVPSSCLRCRKTFNSQTSYLWHVANLCGRKKTLPIKQFKCRKCPKEFSLRSHLLLHLAGHEKNNCSYCKTVLTRRSHLVRHLLAEHNVRLKRDIFKCDYCQKSFIKRRSLHLHLQNHLTSEFVCVECGTVSKSLVDHRNHEREHSKRKPWCCSHCDAKFTRRQLYFAHLNRHERYKCLTCKKSFSSKMRVWEHKSKGHDVKGLEPCPYCPLTFRRKKLLEKHVALHEAPRAKIPCTYCNNFDRYCEHCSVEEEVVPYVCEYCGQQYANKYVFEQHLVKDHDKNRGPYYCAHCDYTTKFKPNITRHVGLHFSKERQFVCDHCGKFFSNGAVLTDHIKYVHQQIKLFKCSLCEKSFKRNTELTRHQSTHSSLRPFNCAKCPNSYKRISHLRRHEKNTHGIANKTNRVQRLKSNDEEMSASNPNDRMLSAVQESVRFDFRDLELPMIEFVGGSTQYVNNFDAAKYCQF